MPRILSSTSVSEQIHAVKIIKESLKYSPTRPNKSIWIGDSNFGCWLVLATLHHDHPSGPQTGRQSQHQGGDALKFSNTMDELLWMWVRTGIEASSLERSEAEGQSPEERKTRQQERFARLWDSMLERISRDDLRKRKKPKVNEPRAKWHHREKFPHLTGDRETAREKDLVRLAAESEAAAAVEEAELKRAAARETK